MEITALSLGGLSSSPQNPNDAFLTPPSYSAPSRLSEPLAPGFLAKGMNKSAEQGPFSHLGSSSQKNLSGLPGCELDRFESVTV